MTDAPELIWALKPDIFDNVSVWQDEPSPSGDAVEYVRADLHEALRAERDRLRGALEECERLGLAGSAWEPDACPQCEDTVQVARTANTEGRGDG